MIKRIFPIVMIAIMAISTPASADVECGVKDAAIMTGGGAGVGAVAAVASIWTLGILAAPFTMGGSIATAAVATPSALMFGAGGGAFYGASAEAVVCANTAIQAVVGE